MKTLLTTLALFAIALKTLSAQSPDFSPNHNLVFCGPKEVYFVCTAPTEPHNIWWDFGDGTTATGIHPVHQYTTIGSYDVKLVIEKNGILDSITKTAFVTVKPEPQAKFEKEVAQILEPFHRKFKFTGFSNAISIDHFSWKVNDTLLATTENFIYDFPRSDWFEVSLTIENNVGCIDIFKDSILVNGQVMQLGLSKSAPKYDYEMSTSADQRQLRIEKKGGTEKDLTVTIYDITGKVELKKPLDSEQTSWLFDISSLYPGIHIVEVSNKSYVAVKRLQKWML
jgi:hypothetical protein